MADATAATIRSEPEHYTEEKPITPSPLWHRLALGAVMLISLLMNFFQLGQNGFANLYYAAGVRSMADSWHNFFFVSYDPGGYVSLDKPPLGFWLQTASVKLFGFTPFSVYLPQALAGVLSVVLLYWLVRRHFGVVAGLLAALALAISPISVVTNRNNTIDSVLALVILLGAWAVLRAAETGRLRWLLLCAVIVGIGFNVKMLEAYLVVPAFGLLYLVAAPKSVWKRIGHLVLAGVLLLAVSLSWALAVDLTPASQRPYVGSSQDNSEISLAFGYNGIDRVIGRFGIGRGRGTGIHADATNRFFDAGGNGEPTAGTPPTGTNGDTIQLPRRPAGFEGNFGISVASPLRLFSGSLGGQIAWLLPLAILGAVALAWQRRPRLQRDRQQQSLVLWGMWLLTMGVFFSVASFFHPYYLTEMAPAVCALFGIGLVVMWQDYRRSPHDKSGGYKRGWLLPLALLLTAVEQAYILASYPAWGQWLIPLMAVLCVLGAVILIVVRLVPRIRVNVRSVRYLLAALSIGVLALLIAPTVWAAIPVVQNTETQLPQAGPSQGNDFGGFGGNGRGGQGQNASVDPALVRYLEANQGKATFLVATPSSMTADGIILTTNKPVMALGGFSGSDPILTTDQLTTFIANGIVRFFLLNSFQSRQQPPPQILDQFPEQFRGRFRGGFGGGFQSPLTTWVAQHCTKVPTSLWQSSSTNAGGPGLGRTNQLYDCAVTH